MSQFADNPDKGRSLVADHCTFGGKLSKGWRRGGVTLEVRDAPRDVSGKQILVNPT